MNQSRTERFIILLVTFACVGLTVESVMLGWEFWVPPLIIIGTIGLWIMNISGTPSYSVRKGYYLIYAMLAALFHGVHETSFFDVSIVFILVMVTYSFLNHLYMMYMFLIEYFCVRGIQVFLALKTQSFASDPLNISRVVLHVTIVVLIFFTCVKAINDRQTTSEATKELEDRIEAGDADIEDFLTNISHELRTPVNVVNGMSELLIKKNAGKEAFSIKDAGIRLAYQIEDILDYTECKRNKVMLEEEDYMSTSLINDVVTSFRLINNENKLEMVVNIDPNVPTMMKGDLNKLHKIFRHLLDNAVKFTKQGGIYVKLNAETMDYGVNLCIEVTDTGIGMDRKAIESLKKGMYQANKKRDRSSGGIGLGMFIVHGFAHEMGGFVKVESEKRNGTTVRVTIPQKVSDPTPCLSLSPDFSGDVLFHVRSDKYKVPKVRDFYRSMAANLATGIHARLYSAETINEIEHLRGSIDVSYIFMGQEEYEANFEYFDEMSKNGIVIAVSANPGLKTSPGSKVILMPKPLYAYPVVKILNEGTDARDIEYADNIVKPAFRGVRALVVDDEPMNLVVATGLFKDYEMIIDTAESGKEAISKFRNNEYDIVFMDHMMPEMDGVEAMKQIKHIATEQNSSARVVALTANAVSGAREMFIREGFDGFIAKPINIAEFERVMQRVLPGRAVSRGGEKA